MGLRTAFQAITGEKVFKDRVTFQKSVSLTGPLARFAIGHSAPIFMADLRSATAVLYLKSTVGANRVGVKLNNTGGNYVFGAEGAAGAEWFAGTSAYACVIGTDGAYALQLVTNNAVRMTVLSGGNTGFATATPDCTVTVRGNFNVTASDYVIATTGTSILIDAHAGNDYARISALKTAGGAWGSLILQSDGGNVGIGTATPVAIINPLDSPVLSIRGTQPGIQLSVATAQSFEITETDAGVYISISGAASAANNFMLFRLGNVNGNYTLTNVVRFTGAGVGILMIPTYTLDVTGNFRCSTGFGCNGTLPQTALASGGLPAYATGAFGCVSAAQFALWITLITNMRAALVADGVMS